MDGIRVEYIVEGEPERVRCSGDKNQTEVVWMQRLEEGRRESEECVFMDVVKVCRFERRGCGGEGKLEAAAQNRSKQDL